MFCEEFRLAAAETEYALFTLPAPQEWLKSRFLSDEATRENPGGKMLKSRILIFNKKVPFRGLKTNCGRKDPQQQKSPRTGHFKAPNSR